MRLSTIDTLTTALRNRAIGMLCRMGLCFLSMLPPLLFACGVPRLTPQTRIIRQSYSF